MPGASVAANAPSGAVAAAARFGSSGCAVPPPPLVAAPGKQQIIATGPHEYVMGSPRCPLGHALSDGVAHAPPAAVHAFAAGGGVGGAVPVVVGVGPGGTAGGGVVSSWQAARPMAKTRPIEAMVRVRWCSTEH